MTNNAQPLLGTPTSIDVRAIERDLNALWKQTTNGPNGDETRAVTRVCVLNLVIGVHDNQTADQATEIVARLMTRHPNRAILVNTKAQDEPLLDAWVQAHCQMPGPGRPQVCCEQITIDARGSAVTLAPGTVLPLLVPDLPVMFWWPRGEPFNDLLYTKLYRLADRLIVDSATFADPGQGLVRLSEACGGSLPVSDLAWGRLTPVRELIAQFFDVPAALSHLQEISRVNVAFTSTSQQRNDMHQAVLLASWLASKLGWSPVAKTDANGHIAIEMQRGDRGTVVVALHPVDPSDDTTGQTDSITLECSHAKFYVARGATENCAEARAEIADKPVVHRAVRFEKLVEDELISAELQLLGRDYTFESALGTAVKIWGML
ncbi:MAG: glucose-6-phosphate dehydrogenase assembly protein OpcA [Chloroflexi bacterium AL-W]|nr:glucose-6-phosphate dehydrogenase assembly protein OpcA [Chloroflexi bacterium AL-N1]NOK68151.1 glucose-6-phosphate dehydrogenase assembly protein OpcA [Chloroflexi bacterium AL-N10]NOK73491.1 glucose-6-phosphate dehydrogenase assembly protein OpcA [Chloroflexi bacterium AL-N5]NOK83405.1 glucose-6-phosphate dehydrogenase assembly protein OpcA [Chloroflexi bacterium AL-W]NOK87822.1 glucose-6-phosphate dehydrogenase assembly protein OpcA [Chloroflexi bacterium AL-N15]